MPSKTILPYVAFVCATLSLLWPALLHGKPFLFPDTGAYVRVADAAVYKAFGVSSGWTRPGEVERMASESQRGSEDRLAEVLSVEQKQLDQNRVPLLGRSIYYGFLAYGSAWFGSFWLLVIAQSVVVAMMIRMVVNDLGGGEQSDQLNVASIVIFLTGVTSSLPFFTSFVMPDVFAGVAILSAAMLMFSPSATHNRLICWFLLAAAAALFHSSHVLILISLGFIGALVTFSQNDRRWRRIGIVFAAALIGLVGEIMFVKGVDVALGSPPVRPPFVTARLIDDGPGLRYLNENCAKQGFYLCRFKDRLPQGSDNFLWNANPAEGVFNTLDPVGKRKLADEQGRFVLNVVLAYPIDVFASTAGAAARQLGLMRLSEFRDIDRGNQDETTVPLETRSSWHNQVVLAPIVDTYANFSVLVALVALIVLPILVSKRFLDGRLALTIVAGVLVNAMICGGLSTPHDRYGARVLWVIPLLAASAMSRLAPRQSKLPPWHTEPAAKA